MALPAAAALQARAQAPFPLAELMARLAQPASRGGSFVEDKTIGALTTPLQSTGRLSYAKPSRLEKLTSFPQQESLLVDGNRLIINGGAEPPRVVELDGQPELRALVDTIRGALSGDLTLLQRLYDVAGTGTLADWHLVLHPRDPAIAKLVREVDIDGGADVRMIRTISPNGDTDTLRITPTL